MSRRRHRPRPPEQRFAVLPGEGRRYSHLKQAAAFYLILALTALIIFQAGYHWLGSLILARRIAVVTAEPGVMERSVDAGGMITRTETVIHAPSSGVIIELHPPGERVAAGTPLVTILVMSRNDVETLQAPERNEEQGLWAGIRDKMQGWFSRSGNNDEAEEPLVVTGEIPPWFRDRVTVTADAPGFLASYIDGWEQPEESSYLSREQFEASTRETFEAVEGLFVEEGQPFLKIIDNWQWRYSVLLPANPGRTMAAQQNVTIEFDFAPGKRIDAILERYAIDGGTGEVSITYLLKKQLPGFERARWSAAVISYQREEGIIIPASAIRKQEAETGVFVNREGMVAFLPVKVIKQQDDRVLVEGLPPFSLVITRPELVREGQRLN